MKHTTPTASWNVFQSPENDRWYFHLEAPNHKIIAKCGQSDGYPNALEAIDDVRLVKRILKETRKALADLRSERDKQWYFHLPEPAKEETKEFQSGAKHVVKKSAPAPKILLTSEGYKTSTNRKEGVNDVMAYFTCDITVLTEQKMKP